MDTKTKEYAGWFGRRRGPRNLEVEAEILAIAEIYDAIQKSGTLTDEQLKTIVDGASSSNQLMWDSVSVLLTKLAEKWPSAAHAIMQMARSSKAHVRFTAICALGKLIPFSISDAILEAGLKDKNARVRSKAAEKAMDLSRVNLVPNIEEALRFEPNELVRKNIELSLRMLRDGFWLKLEPNGRNTITVRTFDGGISGRFITEEELHIKGLDRIAEELRK